VLSRGRHTPRSIALDGGGNPVGDSNRASRECTAEDVRARFDGTSATGAKFTFTPKKRKVRGRRAGQAAHTRHRSLVPLTQAGSREGKPSNRPAFLVNGDQGGTIGGVL
jgi:hypothetical protein